MENRNWEKKSNNYNNKIYFIVSEKVYIFVKLNNSNIFCTIIRLYNAVLTKSQYFEFISFILIVCLFMIRGIINSLLVVITKLCVLQFMWLSSILRWKWLQAVRADSQSRVWVWLSVLGRHLWLRYIFSHDNVIRIQCIQMTAPIELNSRFFKIKIPLVMNQC